MQDDQSNASVGKHEDTDNVDDITREALMATERIPKTYASVAFSLKEMNDKQARLVLCDYGSLSKVGARDSVATYPPPESPRGVNVVANERSILHGLGALLVSMYSPDSEYSLRFLSPKRNHTEMKTPVESFRVKLNNVLQTFCQDDEFLGEVLKSAWSSLKAVTPQVDVAGALASPS
jgi:hypothetical protein